MTTQVIDLGYRARPWQARVRAALKRWSVVVVHRRGGKTVFAVATLVDAALRTSKTSARYAYLAPLRHQAKGLAWDYLKGFGLKVPGTTANESELYVQFPNGSRITVYGADNPDALRGFYFDGVVIDEVSDMKPQVWGEVLRPALADRHGWALFIGTPKGANLLNTIFHDARMSPSDWYADLLTYMDTGALTADELESMKRTMSDAQFRQEMLCDWEASSDDILITADMVRTAQRRSPKPDAYNWAPMILGVDVARMGGDRAVIARRQGVMVWPTESWAGIDNMTLVAEIARRCELYKPAALFIDAGRGEGVIDRLRELHYKPIPVDFGGTKGVPPGYANKAAEMWSRMAEGIREGWALPPDDRRLADALVRRHYSFSNAANEMELAMKKDERGHLDEGDALALTTAFPVAADLPELQGSRRHSRARIDDPWSDP